MDMSTQMEQIERRFLQEECSRTPIVFSAGLRAAGGGWPLRVDVVKRRPQNERDWNPHGARGPSQDVLRLMMRESMILVGVGVMIGIAIALGTSRLVATFLFGLHRPTSFR